MYCKMCGKQINEGKELCEECEAKSRTENAVGNENNEVVAEVPNVNNNNENANNVNGNNNTQNNVNAEPKSKLAAGLFGIFLGGFGVHNFYLGYTGKAVAQLLITVLTCGFGACVSSIWGLIEGILILSSDNPTDAFGNPLRN